MIGNYIRIHYLILSEFLTHPIPFVPQILYGGCLAVVWRMNHGWAYEGKTVKQWLMDSTRGRLAGMKIRRILPKEKRCAYTPLFGGQIIKLEGI